jgi:hypothetical protein
VALTKKQRAFVFNKSGGLCWYCGCELPEKGWHADHFEAIRRYKDFKITDEGIKHFTTCENPHLDVIENMVPSCRPCNLFKSTFSIEEFRLELSYQVERARKYSVNFRAAERFGIIKIDSKPIEFWFESAANLTREGKQ